MENYKLIFYQSFLLEFGEILDFIERDDSAAANRVYSKVFKSLNALTKFPKLGFCGKVENTFEIIPEGLPYTVVYQVNETSKKIIITNILHHAQDR